MSLLPSDWSYSKICQEFEGSTKWQIKTAKQIQNDNYVDASLRTTKKVGPKFLDQSIEEKIVQFYESEENSKQLPGKRDSKSVIQKDGKRQHVQKKLVLMNISELYENFKEKYPDVKIGFSKFASLRPQHCVLAGSSGTHTVCVCTIHENVKLMLEGELKNFFDF